MRRQRPVVRHWFLLLVVGTSLGVADARPADATTVTTTEGRVSGIEADGVRQFLGIPFAAPPTGARRWQAPAAPAKHRTTLAAHAFRSACPQVERFHLTEGSVDEDCLYLNVAVPSAAPSDGRPRPVLFWIHGGAYVGGGANLYRIDHLARHGDLVVVSINYRLGALGYLSNPALDPAAEGAYGIADQVAALRWVHANIRRFGGDPRRVVIAGESAGAGSVCALLAAPEQVGGLYAGAIVQSAGCAVPWRTLSESRHSGASLVQSVGCAEAADVAGCLRTVPVERLLDAQGRLPAGGLVPWAPAVGSPVLPRQPLQAVRAGLVHVPVINGGTRDEMRLYVGYEVADSHPLSVDDYVAHLGVYYPGHAQAVLAQYPPGKYSSPSTALGSALSDYGPGIPLANCSYLQFATALASHTAVWEYEFADRMAPPVMADPGIELGAVHSAELPYLFPGFSNHSAWEGPPLGPASAQVATSMVHAWSRFAHRGTPTLPDGSPWPRFHGGRSVYRFDAPVAGLVDAGNEHHCDFWQSIYPELQE